MTDERCRNIAAGFINVLKSTAAVRDAWVATPKSNADALCTLIAQTLALAEVPTQKDLRAIATHMDAMLAGKAEGEKSHRRVRHLVGA